MAYKFPSTLTSTRYNIDEAGTQLLTPAFSVFGTLGAFIEISVGITASGNGYDGKPETVYQRTFTLRWKFYTQQGSANPLPSSNGFRFNTGSAPAAAAPMQFFSSNAQTSETNENFSATLQVVSSTQILVKFRYYCTSGDENYVPYFVNNLNRLLASNNNGNFMELQPGSQFEIGSTGISLVMLVSDAPPTTPPTPPYITVTRGGTDTLKEYWTPIVMKWPGRNVGSTAYEMYLDEFEVTTRNGDVLAAKTHRDTALPHQVRYDENFIQAASEVSSFEDNLFRFKFLPGGIGGFTCTSVRVLLLRTDNVPNDQHFLFAYRASIAKIPASDTTENQIEGDIYAPASFVNGAGFWEVSFRVPGTALEWGATYRAVCVMYGTTSAEIYSGISHELIATAFPNFYPKADLYFADPWKESVLPKGIAAYHSPFRSRIEIHKRTVADAFTYYGLTGDFDSNVQYVRGNVMKPGTENVDTIVVQNGLQQFLWLRGSGLVQGGDFISDADYMVGAFTGFVDEEWLPYAAEAEANYYVSIQWEIGTETVLPNGETLLLVCQYQQKIVARRWESEAGQPSTPPFTLTMGLYRADGSTVIPQGTAFVCGGIEVVALVEKGDVLAGGGLDAFAIAETYAETDTAGNTTAGNIRQRRAAFGGFLPAWSNPDINAYDDPFSENAVFGLGIDDSGAKIAYKDLNALQTHWFVMLARPDNTDESPFIAVVPEVEMVRDGSNVTTVTADFTAWRAAFDALLTGADTVNDFRIQNMVTQNFAGITAGGSGNPASGGDVCEVIIDHKKSPILKIEVVYDIQGTISGHLVRFLVRMDFALPTSAGTLTGLINPSDWKIIDYDY